VGPRPLSSHARCTVTASGLCSAASRFLAFADSVAMSKLVLFRAASTERAGVFVEVFAPSNGHQHVSQRPTLGARHYPLGARRFLGAVNPCRHRGGRIALLRGAPRTLAQCDDTVRALTVKRSSAAERRSSYPPYFISRRPSCRDAATWPRGRLAPRTLPATYMATLWPRGATGALERFVGRIENLSNQERLRPIDQRAAGQA
jgi:hypothetical protein